MAEAKLKTFLVIKEFTMDKKYQIGSKIELSDSKIIEILTSNKFIK